MYAIVLTFDRQIAFARLVIESYSKLWPNCPFIFRVPYNREFPHYLSSKSNVELVRTEKDIRSTISNLLIDIDDDEFVFWAIDDRYPVRIRDLSGLEEILALVLENPAGIDEVKLTNHGREIFGDEFQEIFGDTRFGLQIKNRHLGFYMHHFAKAKVLRKYFLSLDLPDDYTIRQFHEKLLEEEVSEEILMPEKSLVHFGEACRRGKMTVNALYDLRKYNIGIPDMEQGNDIIIYEDRGEKISDWRYKTQPEGVAMTDISTILYETLSSAIPQWVKRHIPQTAKNRVRPQKSGVRPQSTTASLSSYIYLQKLMSNYQVEDLVNADPISFRKKIDEFLQLRDHEMESFEDPEKQRDLSIQFHWGHDHDFGDFFLKGAQESRHIRLLATFIDELKAIPRSLDGLRVLDIGCWTGGTSLLLCAMGAHVVAIEEVKKYVDCLNHLKHAFEIKRLEPKNLSLYELTEGFYDSFDIVLFAGVLYHVTDPVLALRITFNCLKDGGVCLLETAITPSEEYILSYEGPTVCWGGNVKELSRRGWNWFKPSSSALSRMMSDVGYTDIRVRQIENRAFAVARREAHVDMLRAGLSVRNIR